MASSFGPPIVQSTVAFHLNDFATFSLFLLVLPCRQPYRVVVWWKKHSTLRLQGFTGGGLFRFYNVGALRVMISIRNQAHLIVYLDV